MEHRPVRELKQQEIRLVERLLDRDMVWAKDLESQLFSCLVYPMNDDETIIRFQMPLHLVAAHLPYKQNVAVEASAKDADGCRVEVLLHVKNGFLYELEYIRTDGSPLQSKPTAENLADFIVH